MSNSWWGPRRGPRSPSPAYQRSVGLTCMSDVSFCSHAAQRAHLHIRDQSGLTCISEVSLSSPANRKPVLPHFQIISCVLEVNFGSPAYQRSVLSAIYLAGQTAYNASALPHLPHITYKYTCVHRVQGLGI